MEKTEIDSATTRLVIQSFGKESEYRRAWLCMLSYAAHHPQRENALIILFTDNPAYFQQRLPGFQIEFVLLTSEKIRVMRGDINFLHRMKIALIQEAFELHPGNILYADSDTFFIDDPTPIFAQISSSKSFMHLHEYTFEHLKSAPLPAGEPAQAFYKLITTKKFVDTHGQEFQISPRLSSWNAGVMFLHGSHHQVLPDVYALTDQFYPETHNHASEQFAFSILLQTKTELAACDHVIYHYWYRIKKSIMDDLLIDLESKFTSLSIEAQINEIRLLTERLPALLENHVLTLRDNAIQAFHENQFSRGYRFAVRALMKEPFNGRFLMDIAYHTRKGLARKLKFT